MTDKIHRTLRLNSNSAVTQRVYGNAAQITASAVLFAWLNSDHVMVAFDDLTDDQEFGDWGFIPKPKTEKAYRAWRRAVLMSDDAFAKPAR